MIKIGEYNQLEVLRDTSSGWFLGDEEGDEVLLPGKYIPREAKVGDTIEVFVYRDKEDRAIATTLKPKITLHQFALLEAKIVNKLGAFMDWGLDKDIFVPFSEQPKRLQAGEFYVVYLYLDEGSDRLVASANINRFLKKNALSIKEGDKVNLLVCEQTELGFNVIINDLHLGLIYHTEVFAPVKIGDKREGFIKKIRSDNKIDVILQRGGYHNMGSHANKISEKLKNKGGFLPLSDNSTPEEIYYHLEMSKKNFKKAIGLLYKQKLIRIEENGVYLLDNQ